MPIRWKKSIFNPETSIIPIDGKNMKIHLSGTNSAVIAKENHKSITLTPDDGLNNLISTYGKMKALTMSWDIYEFQRGNV